MKVQDESKTKLTKSFDMKSRMKLKNVNSNDKSILVNKTYLIIIVFFYLNFFKIEFKKQLHMMLFCLHCLHKRSPHNFHFIN